MAETSGLLNRRTGYSRTEGSNPSVSATCSFAGIRPNPKNIGNQRRSAGERLDMTSRTCWHVGLRRALRVFASGLQVGKLDTLFVRSIKIIDQMKIETRHVDQSDQRSLEVLRINTRSEH